LNSPSAMRSALAPSTNRESPVRDALPRVYSGGLLSRLCDKCKGCRCGSDRSRLPLRTLDPTSWNLAEVPFSHRFLPLYADHVGRLPGALRGKSRRCLILDLGRVDDRRGKHTLRGVAVVPRRRCLIPRRMSRFQSPLVEPDVQISCIRLSRVSLKPSSASRPHVTPSMRLHSAALRKPLYPKI